MARVLTDHPARGERTFRMGYDGYRRTVDESAHAEWVEGEVTLFKPPGDRHQDISGFLIALLHLFLRLNDLGVVRGAAFEMRLRLGRSYREPDLIVVVRERLRMPTPTRMDGPADIAIEIVSPESVTRDTRDQRREYAEAGVREYWTVDTVAEPNRVDVLVLGEHGAFAPVQPDADGRLPSTVLPGFWLDPAWFAAPELPSELGVLRLLLPDAFGADR